MKKSAKGVGLAIVGGGRVGLFRGEVAARHPAVEWIGLAEKNPNRAGEVAPKISADFVTQSHVELLKRPEVTAAIICTDEHLHVDPIMVALERGIPLLIEKPLATRLDESARVLKAIKEAKVDAVVGYTQRFRRRWLAAKEKCRTGALGDVTLVTSRAFMNRLVAIDNYKRTDDPSTISPMVISGTHALDICMWCLEGKTPVEVYARSIDKVLGPLYQGIDATAGMITFDDGTLYHLNMSWALPVTWPPAVYSLNVGIIGTTGALTIDDTHSDIVLAVSKGTSEGYNPDSSRLVDFLGSYPPGDMALGELRGPMALETDSWLNRVALGLPTAAATVEEAHRNLMLTKALDLSAKRKAPVKLPLVTLLNLPLKGEVGALWSAGWGSDRFEGDDPHPDPPPLGGGKERDNRGYTLEPHDSEPTIFVLALTLLAAAPLHADDYPARPIHVIVPFAPGGATDVAMRLLQPALAQALGQTLVIDNRGGASGSVGMELAAHAQPDGYTLFFGNVGTVSIDPNFFPQLTVKPERDFVPLSLAGETPGILVASPKFPPNTLKEMVAYAKAHPGKINYGAAGISTLNSLAMEQFRRSAGLEMTQVPYKGGAGPGLLDLIAGNIDMMLVTLSAASSHVKNGQLKALAITTRERNPLFPVVPSLAEQGYPEAVSSSWQGLFAIAGTPQPIVAKLHAAVVKAMADPGTRKLMTDAGILTTTSASPEEFKEFLAGEAAKWKDVVAQVKAAEPAK